MKILLALALISTPAHAVFTPKNMTTLANQVGPILSNCEDLKLDDPVRMKALKNATSESLNKKALLKAARASFEKSMKFADDAKLELRTKVSSSLEYQKNIRTVIYKLDAEIWAEGKKRCEASGELVKKEPR